MARRAIAFAIVLVLVLPFAAAADWDLEDPAK